MPHRKNIVGDLGTTKIASDSYDIDNIYFTQEGWVYRHYKRPDKSKFWDEILVAGEVTLDGSPYNPDFVNDPVEETVTSDPREHLGTKATASIAFEGGTDKSDEYVDFQYSPLYGIDKDLGGGVPGFDSTGDGNTDIPSEPDSGADDGSSDSTPDGAITGALMTVKGTNYSVANDVALTGGSGSGATINITKVDGLNGAIEEWAFASKGQDYGVGDSLTVSGGGGDAIIEPSSAFAN